MHRLLISVLFKARTIRALAELLQYNSRTYGASALVTLQAGEGDNPPLFMLHPIGGTVFCYLSLARVLKHNRTVYGIQDPSIEMEKVLFSSLEEMADAYREIIQSIQPTGPYYLCGASFGANLVVEIAFQLLQQNQKVLFAGLLDGWPIYSTVQYDEDYLQTILLRHKKDQSSRTFPRESENQEFWITLFKHRLQMMLNYKAKKLPVRLSLFKANEILPEYKEIERSDSHWAEYSTFPVQVIRVPGDHHTMLLEPNSKSLAHAIQNCLDFIENEEAVESLV